MSPPDRASQIFSDKLVTMATKLQKILSKRYNRITDDITLFPIDEENDAMTE